MENPTGSKERPSRSLRRRQRSVVALVVVGSLLLPVSVLAVWVRHQVLDTDRWVETVAPLASDPVIVDALAERVSARVSEALDVRSLAEEALSSDASFLAAPIAAGADTLIEQVTDRLLTSDQFPELWTAASRAAHDGLVVALTGREGEVVSAADGAVVLQLGGVAERVLDRLGERFGVDLAAQIPAQQLDVSLVLAESEQLAGAQVAVRWLDRLSWLSVVLALGSLAAAVAVAPDRRRAVLQVGVGIAVAMFLLSVGLGVARDVYLASLPASVERPDAAAAVFDILTRFLLGAVRALVAVGVVVAAGAWLAGPARAAVRLRSWWARALGRGGAAAGSAVDLGRAPGWVAQHLTVVRTSILAAAALLLVVWPRPTAMAVLVVALVTLLPLAAAQLLAAAGRGSDEVEPVDPEPATPAGD